jgi:ectoine hydroxylase-related dioxygenase (phytanoyl-CoA dioxygenase family)
MAIDQSDYDHYWCKGWVVIEDVYPQEIIDRTVELAMTVAHAEMASNAGLTLDVSEDGQEKAPRKIESPFRSSAAFRDFVLDDRLNELIVDLIGHRPLLFSDQIFMKPPKFGSKKPYHQDNFYFRLTPKDHVVTAWIALDDAEEQNGCLRYIDGSHKGDILSHVPVPGEPYNLAPDPELIDESKESIAAVRKGGVVFHHVQTLHTSYRNESDRWRRAYATHWVSSEVRDIDASSGRLADGYFRRPEFASLF